MKSSVMRINWLDNWRGVAVILMIVFHFAFDLHLLRIKAFDFNNLFWFFEGHFIRLTFLIIVGISLVISFENHKLYEKRYSDYLKHHFGRFFKLMIIAMGITLFTWLIFPNYYIRFGILHLISFGILFGSLVVRHPKVSFFLAILSFALGYLVTLVTVSHPYLIFIGIFYPAFNSFDHFPLFPWLGFVFLGITIGHICSRYYLFKYRFPTKLNPLSFLGRHALFIYLIHQPILLAILWPLNPF